MNIIARHLMRCIVLVGFFLVAQAQAANAEPCRQFYPLNSNIATTNFGQCAMEEAACTSPRTFTNTLQVVNGFGTNIFSCVGQPTSCSKNAADNNRCKCTNGATGDKIATNGQSCVNCASNQMPDGNGGCIDKPTTCPNGSDAKGTCCLNGTIGDGKTCKKPVCQNGTDKTGTCCPSGMTGNGQTCSATCYTAKDSKGTCCKQDQGVQNGICATCTYDRNSSFMCCTAANPVAEGNKCVPKKACPTDATGTYPNCNCKNTAATYDKASNKCELACPQGQALGSNGKCYCNSATSGVLPDANGQCKTGCSYHPSTGDCRCLNPNNGQTTNTPNGLIVSGGSGNDSCRPCAQGTFANTKTGKCVPACPTDANGKFAPDCVCKNAAHKYNDSTNKCELPECPKGQARGSNGKCYCNSATSGVLPDANGQCKIGCSYHPSTGDCRCLNPNNGQTTNTPNGLIVSGGPSGNDSCKPCPQGTFANTKTNKCEKNCPAASASPYAMTAATTAAGDDSCGGGEDDLPDCDTIDKETHIIDIVPYQPTVQCAVGKKACATKVSGQDRIKCYRKATPADPCPKKIQKRNPDTLICEDVVPWDETPVCTMAQLQLKPVGTAKAPSECGAATYCYDANKKTGKCVGTANGKCLIECGNLSKPAGKFVCTGCGTDGTEKYCWSEYSNPSGKIWTDVCKKFVPANIFPPNCDLKLPDPARPMAKLKDRCNGTIALQ